MQAHERAIPATMIRPLVVADLADYKAMRDEMLLAHPEAFTSDADAEKSKEPADYLQRLGLDRREGGHFLLGAWVGRRLVGAIGCERETRLKVRHVGHIVGMMVRPEERGRHVGRALLDACIGAARQTQGMEMLTLSVTAGNAAAIGLYATSGFTPYGTLPRAIKVGAAYHDKLHMQLVL